MHRQPDLRKDREHLARLVELSNETEAFYRSHPPLARLRERLTSLTGYDEILDCADEELDLAAVRPVIEHELALYRDIPFYNSPVLALQHGAITGLTLLSTSKILVTLMIIDAVAFNRTVAGNRTKQSVRFPAGDTSLKLLSGRDLALDLYKAQPIMDDTPVTPETRCDYDRRHVLQEGERIVCRGGAQAMQYASLGRSAVLLQVYCRRKRGSVIADYDGESLKLKNLVAADQSINRLQVVATLARRFGRRDVVPVLARLTVHPDHYVRWHAAREMTVLSPELALPVLRRMADADHNTGIRRNARATLTYLNDRGIHAT